MAQRYSSDEVRSEFGFDTAEFELIEQTEDSYTFKRVVGDEVEVHVVALWQFERPQSENSNGTRDYMPWDPFGEVLVDTYYQYGNISASNMTLTRPTKIGIYVSAFSEDVAAIAAAYAVEGDVYVIENNVAVLQAADSSVKVQVVYNNPVAGGQKTASNYNTTRGVAGPCEGRLYMQLKYTDGTTSEMKSHKAES